MRAPALRTTEMSASRPFSIRVLPTERLASGRPMSREYSRIVTVASRNDGPSGEAASGRARCAAARTAGRCPSNMRRRMLANTAALSKISTAAHASFHRCLKCVVSDTLIARLLARAVAHVRRQSPRSAQLNVIRTGALHARRTSASGLRAPHHRAHARTCGSRSTQHRPAL